MGSDRITSDVRVRWGTPCIRDTGVPVARVVAMRADGVSAEQILAAHPTLEDADIDAALAWHAARGDDGLYPRPPDPGPRFPRVTVVHAVQAGRPCIRGTRLTVDAIWALHERGFTLEAVLREYPDLEADDVREALAYVEEAGR